jgi:hypothetical protein
MTHEEKMVSNPSEELKDVENLARLTAMGRELNAIITQYNDEQLLIEVFKVIERSHFKDHKMTPDYIDHIRFPRELGDQIGDLMAKRFPDYYKRRYDNYIPTLH